MLLYFIGIRRCYMTVESTILSLNFVYLGLVTGSEESAT